MLIVETVEREMIQFEVELRVTAKTVSLDLKDFIEKYRNCGDEIAANDRIFLCYFVNHCSVEVLHEYSDILTADAEEIGTDKYWKDALINQEEQKSFFASLALALSMEEYLGFSSDSDGRQGTALEVFCGGTDTESSLHWSKFLDMTYQEYHGPKWEENYRKYRLAILEKLYAAGCEKLVFTKYEVQE